MDYDAALLTRQPDCVKKRLMLVFYLAAAEQLGAELWTVDQALVNNAQQIGASWVHWMVEVEFLDGRGILK